MRTVSYRLADVAKVTIALGHVAENDATRVQIDAGQIFAEYPDAVPALTLTNPDSVSYPAVVVRDGNNVIWDVKDSDLAVPGTGEFQLTFTDNGTVVKSCIGKTKICRSIVGEGPAPDPVQDWIDRAEDVLEEIETAFPEGGTTGQVLAKKSDADFDTEWVDQGAGGVSDYDDLENRPQIGGVTLTGDKSLSDLGAASASEVSAKYTKPSGGIPATDIADGVIQDPTSIIDDTAGDGDTNKVWSADKVNELKSAIHQVTPEQFGAKGDGVTDDSQAVQDAVDAGYDVYFASNKTYYLASTVTIDHDCHLIGGKNTVIKTVKPDGGSAYNGIEINGTLKKTTTLTTDYTSNGNTANSNNKFTLSDMEGIAIGDIMVISATDQYYNYAREYYILGEALLITDVYDGHIYTSDSMPWDISNTENVSVKIFSAPVAKIENLTFMSNGFNGGNYRYLLKMSYCKNSTVKDCTFTQMDNGISLEYCASTKVSNVSLSKSKNDNTDPGDGYGIVVFSCYGTIIERIISTCAQHAISVSGSFPSVDTYIRNCDLTSECREPGLDTHEPIYNLVVEDCVLGTAALNGVSTLNRCRIINNRRVSSSRTGVSVYGNYNQKWSHIRFVNTVFDGTSVYILQSSVQNPVQAYDNVFGNIEIVNCTGGLLNILPSTDSTILSNTIKSIVIKNWKNCKEIYNSGSWKAEEFIIADSTFIEANFINDHEPSHGIVIDNIEYLDVRNTNPLMHKVTINKDTNGESVTLPRDVQINVSSSNSSAKYIVCGVNLTSNDVDDYCIGQVGGSAGGTINRTVVSGSEYPSISLDSDGNIVYSQGIGSNNYCVYPVGMFYLKEPSAVAISASLVNSGNTSGATFRPFIAAVDCKTGKLIDRWSGTPVTASAQGESISYGRSFNENIIAMCYLYCNVAVAESETTFADLSITCTPLFAPAVINEPYQAHRRTGDGTMLSLAGVNNIMCSDTDFHVELKSDYVNNPIGLLPSATGVSF